MMGKNILISLMKFFVHHAKDEVSFTPENHRIGDFKKALGGFLSF